MIKLSTNKGLTTNEQIQLLFNCSTTQTGSNPLISSLQTSIKQVLGRQYNDFRNNNYQLDSNSEIGRLTASELHQMMVGIHLSQPVEAERCIYQIATFLLAKPKDGNQLTYTETESVKAILSSYGKVQLQQLVKKI